MFVFFFSDRNTHNDEARHWGVGPVWEKGWGEKSLHLWEGSWEVSQLSRAVSHVSVVLYRHLQILFRLLAANPSLSEASVHILLERGLVQVEDGMWVCVSLASSLLLSHECFSSFAGFVFSRDLRVNFVSHFLPSETPHLPLSFRHIGFCETTNAISLDCSTCHFRKTLCASVWSRAWRCSQEFSRLFWLFCKKHPIVTFCATTNT